LLVERVSASSYLNRSARLRDLLHYLTGRVLEEEGCEIREHEVGHKVFGRPPDYDSTADNIVRVHASMLRKRLEQYFATEGAEEAWIIEIPKGNYAPVFRERASAPVEVAPELPVDVPAPELQHHESRWLVWLLAGLAFLFACSTFWLMASRKPVESRPAVERFWSQVFSPDRPTDVVLDDSAVALYQEFTGKSVSLSEYFDRSYLRGLDDPEMFATLVLRRQSSFANSSFFWKLTQMPEAARWRTVLRFARDYSFRELKANRAILLGNGRTNPWVQPFEAKLGIRWEYDKAAGIYYPVDTWDKMKSYLPGGPGATHEGYCSIALLPNLGGTGNVLIVSATGGSAMNAAADYLADDHAVSQLSGKISGRYFEALIKLTGRSALPRDASIVLARALRKD
jgi:hypothetical protein